MMNVRLQLSTEASDALAATRAESINARTETVPIEWVIPMVGGLDEANKIREWLKASYGDINGERFVVVDGQSCLEVTQYVRLCDVAKLATEHARNAWLNFKKLSTVEEAVAGKAVPPTLPKGDADGDGAPLPPPSHGAGGGGGGLAAAAGTVGLPAMGSGGPGTVLPGATVKQENVGDEKEDRAFKALRRAFNEEGFCCTDGIITKVLNLTDAERGYFLHYMPRRVKTEQQAVGFGVRLLAEIENNGEIMDGWYACHKRDRDGGFPLMTEHQAMRAATLMTLGTEFKFSPSDFLLALRFSTDAYDELINDITMDHCGGRNSEKRGRFIAGRLAEDERGQGKNAATFWWKDAGSCPMVLNNKLVGEVLSEMYGNRPRMPWRREQSRPRDGARADGETMEDYIQRLAHRRPARTSLVDHGSRLTGRDRRNAEVNGMLSPRSRDGLLKLDKDGLRRRVTKLRTARFNDDLVDALDEKNLLRMARLTMDKQIMFIEMYGSKGGAPARDVNAHVGYALGQFLHLLERGIEDAELHRLRDLTEDGVEVRLGECLHHARGGCRFAEDCKYAHVGEVGSFLRDTEKRLRVDELRGDGGRDSRRRRCDEEVHDDRTVEERINDELPVDRQGRRTLRQGRWDRRHDGQGGDGDRQRAPMDEGDDA